MSKTRITYTIGGAYGGTLKLLCKVIRNNFLVELYTVAVGS